MIKLKAQYLISNFLKKSIIPYVQYCDTLKFTIKFKHLFFLKKKKNKKFKPLFAFIKHKQANKSNYSPQQKKKKQKKVIIHSFFFFFSNNYSQS